jgi:hypothetical protein
MEIIQEYKLMKARSYRGIITSALRLYTASFRKIFKATWLFTLVYSLIVSVLGTWLTTKLLPIMLQTIALPQYKWLIVKEHTTLLCAFLVLFILGIMVLLVIFGITAGKLKEHKDTNIIATPLRWFAKPVFWRPFRSMLKAAGRHWLLTLGVLLVELVVVVPICLFVCLPVIILTIAAIQAHIGTLMGDPFAMPSYIDWLAAGTWFLAAFLQVYILKSLLFVGYYAYGSAETQKKEREQQKLNIQ